MQVRPIEAADIPASNAILSDIIRAGGTTAIEEIYSDEVFSAKFVGGATLCCHVVLDDAGNVAGFQWLGRDDSLPEDCANIASFTRRAPPLKGAGRALIAVTTDWARAQGFAQINATIRADNVPGIGYYSAIGFVDHDVTRDVPLRDGTRIDRVHKRLFL